MNQETVEQLREAFLEQGRRYARAKRERGDANYEGSMMRLAAISFEAAEEQLRGQGQREEQAQRREQHAEQERRARLARDTDPAPKPEEPEAA